MAVKLKKVQLPGCHLSQLLIISILNSQMFGVLAVLFWS